MSASRTGPRGDEIAHLRQLAEEKATRLPAESSAPGERTLAELLHELGVHQIELEMQNEALHEAQSNAEAARDRYLELYELAPVGLLSLTRDAIVSEANRWAAELLGVERRQLLGRPFRSFLSAGHLQTWDELFTGLWRTPDRRRVVLELARSTPEAIAVEVGGCGLEPGGPERLLRLSMVDVSARERAEAEVRRFNEHLEQRVQERTAELDSFVYSVAHDLKAPLRAVDAYSQLLVDEENPQLSESGRRLLAKVRRAAQQMALQITGLLSYSRLGRGEVAVERVDLAELVARVVERRSEDIDHASSEVVVNVPDGAVLGMPSALEMIVANLLDNALKFHASDHPAVVRITAGYSGDRCVLAVRDEGIGFDMKYEDQVFGLFRRLGRSEEFEGTGVGLAIVRRAVERMHGRVWAESASGRGATFFVELPA